MDRRIFIKNCLLALSSLSVGKCSSDRKKDSTLDSQAKLPNIIFILADDMGYGDIQAYNPQSKIPTPNLNTLAGESIRFTDAHSGSAVCSPTRYGLLTGQYSWRTWLKKGVLWPPDDKPMIDRDRLTVAGMLKQKAYHSACIGKWHLGMEWGRDEAGKVDFNKSLEYGPTDVGFDEFFGIAGSLDMVPYAFYHNHEPTSELTETQQGLEFPRFIRKGPRASDFDPEKVLDILTDKAVSYIKARSTENTPFFLYFPMTAPHKPVWPNQKFRGKTSLGPYGDFIHQTDWAVGQVLLALEQTGIKDNTLVVFSSDNGSYMYRWPEDQPDHIQEESVQGYHPYNHTANYKWRGTKADVWEAGHRVPFMVRWPGNIKPNSVCGKTICLTDFMATCAEIVGFSLPKTVGEDSFSLVPLIKGKNWTVPRAPVIHHSSNGIFSLREGKWKMVFGSGSGGRENPVGKPFEKPYFLFNMEKDPSETTNLIAKYPEIADRLTKKLDIIMKSGTSRSLD